MISCNRFVKVKLWRFLFKKTVVAVMQYR